MDNFKGFLSQYYETQLDNPLITGDIPKWLLGSFVSNGPAQFEVGKTSFKHWLDGFAMLKKFNFKSGKISFQNLFLHSQQYIKSMALGELNSNEFSTYANSSLLGRIHYSIKNLFHKDIYDNCNVHTAYIAPHFIAMTESSHIIEFKLSDLSTVGSFQFTDNIKAQLGCAHPHVDQITGEIINIAIEIGPVNKYHIYKIPPNNSKREIIQTYHSEKLFYMHSFSLTSNYVILFKSPLGAVYNSL
jgi:carotenoid cleavage dioxygenase-like enzyme